LDLIRRPRGNPAGASDITKTRVCEGDSPPTLFLRVLARDVFGGTGPHPFGVAATRATNRTVAPDGRAQSLPRSEEFSAESPSESRRGGGARVDAAFSQCPTRQKIGRPEAACAVLAGNDLFTRVSQQHVRNLERLLAGGHLERCAASSQPRRSASNEQKLAISLALVRHRDPKSSSHSKYETD